MKIRMTPKNMTFALAFVLATIMPFAAMADKGKLSSGKVRDPMVNIMLGKAEMVDLKGNVSDVLVANPSIVDVMAVKANKLYLVGSALGDTNIMVMDEDGNVIHKLNIHVQMDTEKLEDMVGELYPNEEINIKTLTDQVVVTGSVSTPAVANSVMNLIGQYAAEIQNISNRPIDQIVVNMLKVQGEEQVMLKVKIVEASRSALKDLGIETNLTDSGIGAVGAAITTAASLGLSAPAQLGVLALNYNSGSFGPMNFLARALEEEGILSTLAEPNLTSISGEQAGFLAGGEIPIPTQMDRNGNLVYEFRPFGVSLNFRPTVMSQHRISMEMTTEISSVSYDQNLQLQNGLNVPSFNVRRASTTVELPSGGTLMIAGLLKSDAISQLTQIPGVKDVPIVGDLMKSDTFQRNESEVVVIITPYLVTPFAQNNTIAPVPAEPHPPKAPKPIKTSDKADFSAIPRLSMADLEETETTSTDTKSFAMAPPTGLSQEKMLKDTPLPTRKAEPERNRNALTRVFENNVNRTYNSRKVESVMKDMGSFGYMID
jgi:pilus assembly protein CpaC